MKIQEAYAGCAKALVSASAAALSACVVVPAPGLYGPVAAPPPQPAYMIYKQPGAAPLKWTTQFVITSTGGGVVCNREKTWLTTDRLGSRFEAVREGGDAAETVTPLNGQRGTEIVLLKNIYTYPQAYTVTKSWDALSPVPALRAYAAGAFTRGQSLCDKANDIAVTYRLGEGDSARMSRFAASGAGQDDVLDLKVIPGAPLPNPGLYGMFQKMQKLPILVH